MDFIDDQFLRENHVFKQFLLKEESTAIEFNSFSSIDNLRSSRSINDQLEERPVPVSDFSSPSEIADQIDQITLGIEKLNIELRRLVSENCDQFIEKSQNVNTLEAPLQQLHLHIEGLQHVLQRLKSTLNEPYREISQRMILLSRLQNTCDLMRTLIRILCLGKRLSVEVDLEKHELLHPAHQSTNPICTQAPSKRFVLGEIEFNEQTDSKNFSIELWTQLAKDLIKQAQFVAEICQLVEEESAVVSVEIVAHDLQLAEQRKRTCETLAASLLQVGLQRQDVNFITSALQVFFCFRTIKQQIEQLLQDKRQRIDDQLAITFDSRSNASKLWPAIENLIDHFSIQFSQVSLLSRVLRRKRDLSNHCQLGGDSFDQDIRFTEDVADLVFKKMQAATGESLLIKEALEGEYPKLLRMFGELYKRCCASELNVDTAFRVVLQPFESAYLSRSLSLLFDSVNLVFSELKISESNAGSLSGVHSLEPLQISRRDIDALLKQIQNQLRVLKLDSELGRLVARNVCQCVNLFLVKAEQLVKMGGDSTQVIGPATPGQKTNAMLVERLSWFAQQLHQVLNSILYSGADEDSVKLIRTKLNDVNALMVTIVTPLKSSIVDSIEAILLTMHNENFNR